MWCMHDSSEGLFREQSDRALLEVLTDSNPTNFHSGNDPSGTVWLHVK